MERSNRSRFGTSPDDRSVATKSANERTDRADLANFLVRASEWAELHPPLKLMGNPIPKRNPQSGSAAFLDRFSHLQRRLPDCLRNGRHDLRYPPPFSAGLASPATLVNVSELSAIAYDNVWHG